MLPLDDIRVIDLTVARAGPTAVRQLADWGADVVRITAPNRSDGAGSAANDPDGLNLHRNKRAMTLDLKSDDGQAVLHRMVPGADVVVENMRAPVKHRLGFDYDTLSSINERIVLASISGFGQDGPYADRGGVDQIAQGLGGLMSITGFPGQGPVRVGVPISDLAAGVYLALGIMIALHERERTGRGQWVRTSLLEAMISMLDFQAARWTVAGDAPEQAGNDHPTFIPMGTFETADGHINIAAPGGRLYERFCAAVDAPHLLSHPDYATADLRSRHREALNREITALLATRTSSEWIEALNAAEVPCGPVNSIDETFADPQVDHLGMAVPVTHPEAGDISIIRNALNIGDSSHAIRRPSPRPGEHTAEILGEFGFDPDEIAALGQKGTV